MSVGDHVFDPACSGCVERRLVDSFRDGFEGYIVKSPLYVEEGAQYISFFGYSLLNFVYDFVECCLG